MSDDRLVMISGANRGIGAAIATALAARDIGTDHSSADERCVVQAARPWPRPRDRAMITRAVRGRVVRDQGRCHGKHQ